MGPTRTDEFRKDAVRIALSSKDQDLIRGIKFPEDGLARKRVLRILALACRRWSSGSRRIGTRMWYRSRIGTLLERTNDFARKTAFSRI